MIVNKNRFETQFQQNKRQDYVIIILKIIITNNKDYKKLILHNNYVENTHIYEKENFSDDTFDRYPRRGEFFRQ